MQCITMETLLFDEKTDDILPINMMSRPDMVLKIIRYNTATNRG